MIESVYTLLKKKNIDVKTHKIVVAVSGGIDSVVLLHLLNAIGFKLIVAHVNFQIRKIDALKDEAFVGELAKSMGLEFLSTRFKTKEYAKSQGISIQMAARELRFNWFEQIIKSQNFDFIALGTNLNDQVETSLLNFAKGTGHKGIAGIDVLNGNRLRPLVFNPRQEIEDYALSYNLKWREDSSNKKSVYERNFVRNKIIPLIYKLNPAFDKNLKNTYRYLHDADEYITNSLKQEEAKYISKKLDIVTIDLDKIKQHPSCDFLAFHYLNEYGFKTSQVQNIVHNSKTGSVFLSPQFRLNINRNKAIITPSTEKEKIPMPSAPTKAPFVTEEGSVRIRISDTLISQPVKIQLEWLDIGDAKYKNASELDAYISADKLVFPLKLRKWKAGDFFVPFGMKNHKKVSDFLIDNKVSRNQKEETYVVESAGRVVWLVGHRIDNRFKIHTKTKKVYLMQLKNKLSY